MPHPVGHNLPLPLPRRVVGDLLHFAKKVPLIAMQRRMRLAELAAARAALAGRVGWCPIFLKAYALVAADTPVLRRCYVPWPRPHLYEHPVNVASVAVERTHDGERAPLFAQVVRPEAATLPELHARLRHYKEAPFAKVAGFRRALRLARLPRPLRRAVWWLGLNASGPWHCRYFGTFGVSVTAGAGAASLGVLSPLTTTLNYGLFEPDGALDVRLTYDHRVTDGPTVARALVALDDVLHRCILPELRALPARRAA
jgi:hypothetical protein